MKTIAIIGQKGGTGKTTLAQILLVAFDRAGLAVAGIDLDPQTSLTSWRDLRQDDTPSVEPIPSSRLSKAVDVANGAGVDVLIIDTAGRATDVALDAAKVADLVILPIQPTATDLVTIQASKDILALAKNPPAFAVLMRVKPQGSRHEEAAEFLKGQGIEVCPITIGDRVSFPDAASMGQSPEETAPSSKAADECKQVYMYTCKHLNM